jgi:hypothetical protein
MKSETIGIKKLNAGPGGWHCPCCNPFHCHPRKMKAKARRMVRHINKQNLRKEEAA